MKITRAVFALPLLAMALAAVPAMAQEHQDRDRRDSYSYREHHEWRSGSVIRHEDWDRGQRLDYRQHHLRRPPVGHEWRTIDGHYIMARPDGTIVAVRRAPRERSYRRHERNERHDDR